LKLDAYTADSLMSESFRRLRENIETRGSSISSEATFKFLFAWELGRTLDFSRDYRFDFEYNVYSRLKTEDKFLDLLAYTDPTFKLAFEFKLPKKKTSGAPSPSTQTRAKICSDISRLTYLVRDKVDQIHLGYFLMATDEGGYLNEGRKTSNPQYKTYQGTVYPAETIIPEGTGSNGIPRKLSFPKHEVRFDWEGVDRIGDKLTPKGSFAWLKPIKLWA